MRRQSSSQTGQAATESSSRPSRGPFRTGFGRAGWVFAGVFALLLVGGTAWQRMRHRPERVAVAPEPVVQPSTDLNDSQPPPQQTVATLQAEELAHAHRLLETFPSDLRVLNALGHVHNNQGDRTGAVSYWRQVATLDPGNAAAYDAMAKVAFLKEDHEQAIDLWQRVLEIDPRSAGTHYQLATALMGVGRLEDAAETLEREIQRNPQAGSPHALLGEVQRMLERYDPALESFASALRIDPNSAKACYGLSMVHRALRNQEQSERWMAEFQRLKAAEVEADRDRRSAYDDVEITRATVAETLTEMGRIYARHGDFPNAERLWIRACQLDATQLLCRQDLGQLYQRTSRIERAIEMCRQLSQLEPENADYLVNMGVFYVRLERYDAAIDAFERANALDPNRPGNYRTLARIYLQTDRDAEQAVAHARTAVQLQPNGTSYFVLGTALEHQGDLKAALAALRRAAELEPANRRYQSAYRSLQNQAPRRREGE